MYVHARVLYIICSLTTTSILKYLYVLSKKYLTLIPREHKPIWQLPRLDDFSINAIANLFINERLKIPETYLEPS